MQTSSMNSWQHDHTYGQDRRLPGERRTVIVIAITATMMVVEIVAGLAFGSMALLADGLHMASHAVALAVASFAYIYARRNATDRRFSFGTGKVNSLGGFTGAVLLAVFAALMLWESVDRFIHPVPIRFNQAILVALFGLVVNALSAVILSGKEASGHDQPIGKHDHHAHTHDHRHDHNLRAAYLHVLADALTSLLAIFALLVGKYLGLHWLDPTMGVVGAVLVANWSLGLIRTTSCVLLDAQAPQRLCSAITDAVQSRGGSTVADLHVWAIGPARYAAIVSVVSDTPESPDRYKALLPSDEGLCHVTIEVNVSPEPLPDRDGTPVGSAPDSESPR